MLPLSEQYVSQHFGFNQKDKPAQIIFAVCMLSATWRLLSHLPKIPEPFGGLLLPVKVVQDAIEERTENKVSLLEGRASITLSPDNPSLSNSVNISSANNFMALSESYFLVKM